MLFCSRNQLTHFIAEGQVAAEMLRQSAAIDGDIGCYHHVDRSAERYAIRESLAEE
jgi:hypothetical protein